MLFAVNRAGSGAPGLDGVGSGEPAQGDPAKLELAHQLRARTTLSVAWVARGLSLGSRARLAWLLKSRNTSKPTQPERPAQTLLAM